METISLNSEVINKNSITIGEVLLLLAIHNNENLISAELKLIKNGFITAELNSEHQQIGWRITNKGAELLDTIIIESDKAVINKDKEFIELADKLKELFPKGKKAGTTYMWRDSTAVIARKLKTLVVKYDYQFTEEQAIKATKAYVESFNGDYTYMQLLKYFILKTLPDGEIKSDFMSYIENEGQEDELSDNWLTEMR